MSNTGKTDLYNSKKNVEKILETIGESDNISQKNKKIIRGFYRECISVGLSDVRIYVYLSCLRKLSTEFCRKDYDKLTKDDIKELVIKFERNDEWSDYSKQRYKIIIRKLVQFIEGYEWYSKKYPEKVEWINANIKKKNNKLPSEILSKQDIKQMIAHSLTIRDKAFISVLYESGCRIGEMLTLRIKHVMFDEYGCVINVFGKTGSRRIRLVSSVPLLSQYMQNHPFKDDPDNLLWTKIDNKPMTYSCSRKILAEVSKRGNIKKKVNPHAFRHARATHLANQLTEAQMKEYFGWTQSSNMASIYVHLSGRDVDDAILRIHGVKNDDKDKQKEIETKKCSRCDEINSFDSKYCRRCGSSLNERDAIKIADVERKIINLMSPDVLDRMIKNRIQEILSEKI